MYNVEVKIEKPVQSLSGYIRELRKVDEKLGSKTDAGVRLSPRVINIEEGYNTRFEGYDSPEEYFAVPMHRAYLEKLKAAYRGDPNTTMPPPIQIEIIDSVAYNRDGASRLFAIKELFNEGFEVKQIEVSEVTFVDHVSRNFFLLRAQDGNKFSYLAIGAALNRAYNAGWSHKQLAEERGITVNSVNNFIDAYRLPSQIKRWIADKIISPTLALELVRKRGIQPTIKAIEEAIPRRLAELKKEEDALRVKEEEKQLKADAKNNPEDVAKNEAGDAENQLDIPDAGDDNNAPVTLDGGKSEDATERAMLRPSDLKPKSLPKKLAETFHNSLLDLVSLDDEERFWRDEANNTVTVTLAADEFQKLQAMRHASIQFDNANIERLGGSVIDVSKLEDISEHAPESEIDGANVTPVGSADASSEVAESSAA